MKSKIEFKYDIRKQNVKYPSYLENMKAKSNQVYFTKEKYSKSNQIYFTKINSGTNPLERNIQTISLKVNPKNKFEKKSITFKN